MRRHAGGGRGVLRALLLKGMGAVLFCFLLFLQLFLNYNGQVFVRACRDALSAAETDPKTALRHALQLKAVPPRPALRVFN